MGSLRDSHLCRICAEESLMPSVLFGGDSKELRDKIMFFLPLSILESSDMPRVICQKCNQDLDSLVEFFQTLNQGQIKLLDLLSERKRKRPSWNGKKQSLFDKKYPSGVERKPTHHKKDDEDFSSAYEDPTMLMEHSNGKQEVSFGDTSMRFECLEPSCHLRFQNAQQIEQHLKVENHSTMTLVVPSEVVANQNSLEDPLAVSSSHSNLPELKDLSMPPATASANLKKGRKSNEHSLSLKNRIVGMTEAGMTATQIAKRIPIPRTTIVSIVRKYLSSGNVDNKARSGRPKVWTETDSDRLNFIIKLNKKANIFTIWKLFNESRERKISRMTIRRKIKELRESKRRRGGGVPQSEPPPELHEGGIQPMPATTTTTTISLASLSMDVPSLVLFQEQG